MTERRMLQEISAWLSFNNKPSSSDLKKMKADIDKLLETAHNSDHKMCSHVVDLICDVLLIEKSENMEINLHTIYSEVIEIKSLIRDLREKFS